MNGNLEADPWFCQWTEQDPFESEYWEEERIMARRPKMQGKTKTEIIADLRRPVERRPNETLGRKARRPNKRKRS